MTIVGGNDEIEEESNVTFVCISFDFNSPKFKPTWRYAKKLEKTNFIDEERPPEGETASRNILYCKHLIGLRSITLKHTVHYKGCTFFFTYFKRRAGVVTGKDFSRNIFKRVSSQHATVVQRDASTQQQLFRVHRTLFFQESRAKQQT